MIHASCVCCHCAHAISRGISFSERLWRALHIHITHLSIRASCEVSFGYSELYPVIMVKYRLMYRELSTVFYLFYYIDTAYEHFLNVHTVFFSCVLQVCIFFQQLSPDMIWLAIFFLIDSLTLGQWYLYDCPRVSDVDSEMWIICLSSHSRTKRKRAVCAVLNKLILNGQSTQIHSALSLSHYIVAEVYSRIYRSMFFSKGLHRELHIPPVRPKCGVSPISSESAEDGPFHYIILWICIWFCLASLNCIYIIN